MLNADTAEHIARFRSFFMEHVESISEIGSSLYAKLLLSAILDSLSVARYPGLKNNARLLKMASECFSWPHHNWVSMQQLRLHLAKLPESNLKRRVSEVCSSMQPGHMYQLGAVDCPKEDLVAIAETDNEIRLLGGTTHAALFYQYRNSLVHEFREPGNGIEFRPDPEPFYHSYMKPPRHELVYPVQFFVRSVKSSIAAVADHLEANNIDPYTRYPFGSAWKEKLK